MDIETQHLSELHNLRRKAQVFAVAFVLTAVMSVVLGIAWVTTHNTLSDTQASLVIITQEEQKYSQLSSDYLAKLNDSNGKLTSTLGTLATTQSELSSTQAKLGTTQNQLSTTQGQLSTTQDKLATTQSDLTISNATLQSVNQKLALYQSTYGSVVASGVQPPFLIALSQSPHLVPQTQVSDPTYAQLISFIQSDQTDRNTYIPDVYMCGGFAQDVYNNAERAGIRAAYVGITFASTPIGHACNAFRTTDRGLVFIDCTGLEAGDSGPNSRDKIADVRLGKNYVPTSLFPEQGWSLNWGNLGTVSDVEIYW